MRRLLSMVFLTALLSAVASVDAFARQVALVAGNAHYAELGSLKNPKRDAAAIADRLRDLGFEVIEVFDADSFALGRAAERFLTEAKGADLALFYFAGHGIQLFDRNVLLASDAKPAGAERISDLGLDLTDFMRRLRRAGPVRSALLIDACRDNVLSFDQTVALLRRLAPAEQADAGSADAAAKTRGLARLDPSAAGGAPAAGGGRGETLLFFAAAPGRVSFDGDGQNSYFVEGLKEALASADRPLAQVFQQASQYVRTVTRGEQVPQVVSDWTGDVVLGRTETAKVRYINASAESGGELSDADLETVGRTQRTYQSLDGTFIVRESQVFGNGLREAGDEEKARVDKIGQVNGFAIDYDLDRDGHAETLAVYVRQTNVVFSVTDEGVTTSATPCYDFDNEPLASVELALRDLNGDRRPEIFLHLRVDGDAWGRFCIVEYRGVTDIADARREATAAREDDGQLFRELLRETVMTAKVGADNSIVSCSGSNCHTRSRWKFDGARFTMLEDESSPPQGARALPFRDEAERRALGAVRNESEVAPTVGPASSPPQDAAQASIDVRVADYVSSTYLNDGVDGGATVAFTEQVDYYGERKRRADVLADKKRYYAKWPTRRFELVPGTLVVSPTGTSGVYDVTFEYTFVAENSKRRSEGRGRTRLTLEESDSDFVIAREDGETVRGR